MKIGAKRFLSLMLCCIMVLGLFSVTAFAATAGETVESPFEKVWNDNNASEKRPDSITVSLYQVVNGANVFLASTEVKKEDGWKCKFSVAKDAVVDANGNLFELKVVEGSVAGYTETAHEDPEVKYTPCSVNSKWDRTESCSSLAIPMDNLEGKVVFAKKGNDYMVWTHSPLSNREKEAIFNSAEKGINGFGSLTFEGSKFFSGLDEQSGMQVVDGKITFRNPSDWSFFAIGTYTEEILEVEGASITNTYKGNVPTVGSLTITKSFEGLPVGTTPASVSFTVTGPNSYSQTVTLPDNNQWTKTLDNLTLGEYKVSENEESAKVNGYKLTAEGEKSVTVTADQNAKITFTNRYEAQQPEKLSFSFFLSKAIKQSGNVVPGKQTFTFELVDAEGRTPAAYGIDIDAITVSTDGVGLFDTEVKGTVDFDKVIAVSTDGLWKWYAGANSSSDAYYYCTFTLKENNGGAAGWTYSNEQYIVEIRYYPQTNLSNEHVIACVADMNGTSQNGAFFTNTYSATSAPESNPIRDTVTIEIGNNGKTEEANPDTGAPLMFAPVMAAALAAAVVVKRKK